MTQTSAACVLTLFCALLLSASPLPARELTFEDRVRAQEAIERVYYSHQIGATRPFEEAVPREILERKVSTCLKETVALETFWQTPVTGGMLHEEAERMARRTRMPDRLRELYAALGNDVFLFEETVARAALVDRLARNFFAFDERLHAAARREAEELHRRLLTGGVTPYLEGLRGTVVDVTLHTPGSGLPADEFRALRTRAPGRVGEVGPVKEERDSYVIRMVLDETPEGFRLATFTVRKKPWQDWWNEVAGGLDEGAVRTVAGTQPPAPEGGSLAAPPSCPDDSWSDVSLGSAPTPRYGHTAVWTGSLVVVWGGTDQSRSLSTGGRYDPATDSWTATATTNAPSPRSGHTAVWTGGVMVAWGGREGASLLNTGGRYDPAADSWTATSTTNAPSPRFSHTAVWTGSSMVIWGGYDGSILDTGGRYDPAADSWTATSTTNAPAPRFSHTAVWTGGLMVVWGGSAGGYLNTGGRYDPATDSWTATSVTNAPAARGDSTAVWTGSHMIVWGGFTGAPQYLNTGGRYEPATDAWTAMSTTNAPTARYLHTAVWTGSLMIVWGGFGGTGGVYLSTGGLYLPATDTWRPTATVNSPSGRRNFTATWSGSRMVVWGGIDGAQAFNTGASYDAASLPDLDGDGFSVCDGDCNDDNAAISPGAAEVCNGVDDDCDSQIDENQGNTTCGVGECRRTVANCIGGVEQPCIPGSPSPEACDGFDNDCNGVVDDRDLDRDGHSACFTDCDDNNASTHPGAPETCNGVDDNCNGQVDEDGAGVDSDGDGVRNACDICRFDYDPGQGDRDGDGLGDICDNCPLAANSSQADQDLDQRGDACDNCPATYNFLQDDTDLDGAGDVCDNCIHDFNPGQWDIDRDSEGDACDLNDGLILVTFSGGVVLEWQQEAGFESFNEYRGDLGVLKGTGVYTQNPASVPLAEQNCGLTVPYVFDDVAPPVGQAAFFLVTGMSGGVESSLGQNSAGVERPNAHPCP